ncbi:hypothetical protein MCERH10_02760 [Caulobacteraceae bacterium]|uniref:hypothetical protein n=1 Tax=Aquidulcibacter sp. TaxID=2052990 RepID=UPI003784FF3A
MFSDLIFAFNQMFSIVHLAALSCPAGLIIAMHYMSERKPKLQKIDYDPVMRKKYESGSQPSKAFAGFMTLVGLTIAGVSFSYLAWPSETHQQAQAGWQIIKSMTDRL